jgi:hypothetical protein
LIHHVFNSIEEALGELDMTSIPSGLDGVDSLEEFPVSATSLSVWVETRASLSQLPSNSASPPSAVRTMHSDELLFGWVFWRPTRCSTLSSTGDAAAHVSGFNSKKRNWSVEIHSEEALFAIALTLN